ncbi:MAG: hypothetical protein COA47_12445 [Robiginitomaculum sp.]|nr:MAG: hypothetical protein COA47_12445 [Robiginitomaculum sp.]
MSNYQHGAQNISQHRETYGRILDITVWSGGLIGVSILFFSMVFAAKIAWFPALIISFVTAILTGMVLKIGSAWYATIVGLAILTLIMGMGISAIAGLG